MAKKKRKGFITAFSIILILIFLLGGITYLLPEATFVEDVIVDGSGVVRATLPDVLLAPILGFENAIDVAIFVMVLGGFLAVIARTGALETGIKVLVQKLKGREIILIPILMFIFSIVTIILKEILYFFITLSNSVSVIELKIITKKMK